MEIYFKTNRSSEGMKLLYYSIAENDVKTQR